MKIWEFQDSVDRDNTIVTLLVFASFGGIIWVFHDNLSNDAVIAIVAGCVAWIKDIVSHFFNKSLNSVRAKNGNGGAR